MRAFLFLLLSTLSFSRFAFGANDLECGDKRTAREKHPYLARAIDRRLDLDPESIRTCQSQQESRPQLQCTTTGARIPFMVFASDAAHATEHAMSSDQARQFFDAFKNDPSIPFKYPEDGCYARAHEMARRLEKDGFYSAKVFLEGNLEVQSVWSKRGTVNWWYHVAPVIAQNDSDCVRLVVFDPALFDGPVPVEQWIDLQIKVEPDQDYHVKYRSRFVYNMSSDSDTGSWLDDDLVHMEYTLKNYRKKVEERWGQGQQTEQ